MTSIRVRLLLSLMAMLALAALLIGAVTYRSVLAETEALFDYQLRQMALTLRDQGEIAPDQVGTLTDEQLDFVVQIWTADGRSIYASRRHPDLPARALLGFADVKAGAQVWRTFSVATRDKVIQVAQPLQIRARLAANAALRSVAPLLAIAPLLGLGIWWLAARALAPLQRVAAGVRQRDEQSLAPLPTGGLPDEVEPLVRALNALLERLGASLDGQRAFVADAAHELRSPLTALKLQLQLLRRAPDDAARAEAVDALGAGIERAARLVEQLLTLARSEPGAPRGAFETIDLGALVRDAVAATQAYAASRGSVLACDIEPGCRVEGDRSALGALARHLVDTAVRYSPAGSRIEVGVGRDGDRIRLRVDDPGPGIPPADRDRVFDRFYRRSAGDEDGTGLGLAIVRSVAERHGAELTLDDAPAGGLRVTLRFAAAPAGKPAAPAPDAAAPARSEAASTP
jgi:two-component system OmpR family sensor kinase/two-component system sensor histidine kinase QseC